MVRTRAQSQSKSVAEESSESSLDSNFRILEEDETDSEKSADFKGEVPEGFVESVELIRDSRTEMNVMIPSAAQVEFTTPVQGGNRHSLREFLKLKPPVFRGDPDPSVAKDWLAKMEELYAVAECSDEDKMSSAIFRLEEDAEFWWKSVELRWTRDSTPETWKNFITEFEQQYISPIVQENPEKEFVQLEQGELSVAQYTAQFNRLSQQCWYLVATEERKTKRFLSGLSIPLQNALVLAGVNTFESMQQRALELEIQQSSQKDKVVASADPVPKSSSSQPGLKKRKWLERQERRQKKTQSKAPIITRGAPKCGFCGRGSHVEEDCWKKNGKCLKCGKDHLVRNCPLWAGSSIREGKQPATSERVPAKPRKQGIVYSLDSSHKFSTYSCYFLTYRRW